MFIFEELVEFPNSSFYHGLPKNIREAGMIKGTKETCEIWPKYLRKENCSPMKKEYITQYQWFPFYLFFLSVLYFIPYSIFKFVNTDVISMKSILKKHTGKQIADTYFNHSINTLFELRLRIALGIFVKVLYIVVNVFAFRSTASLLSGNYAQYGHGRNVREVNGTKVTLDGIRYPGKKIYCHIKVGEYFS